MIFLNSLVVILIVKSTISGPVPEFGLPVAVAGSAQVITASNQASALAKTATNYLNDISLRSNYKKHESVLGQLAAIATFTASIHQSIIIPLLALTADTSGNVSDVFKSVLEGITSTQDYIKRTLPADLMSLHELIDHYVPDRLKDGFGCVRDGLEQLSEALVTLENAITSATKEAGTVNVSIVVLKKYVSLKAIHNVGRGVRAVNVCVPSIIDTVNGTVDRLRTADDFIYNMYNMVSTLG